MKKWIGAAVALLFFVGLLAFLLPILGWQKQLNQESAEYEALSSAVQLPQASEPPVVTPSEADSSVLNNLISSLDGDVLSEDIPASSAPARTSSIDLEACKAQNSDFAAWLSIPNTPAITQSCSPTIPPIISSTASPARPALWERCLPPAIPASADHPATSPSMVTISAPNRP